MTRSHRGRFLYGATNRYPVRPTEDSTSHLYRLWMSPWQGRSSSGENFAVSGVACAGFFDYDRRRRAWTSYGRTSALGFDGELSGLPATSLEVVLFLLNPHCGLHPQTGSDAVPHVLLLHPSYFDGISTARTNCMAQQRKRRDGTFREAPEIVSLEAGVANPSGKGLGVTFADFDLDGDVDIYVANDAVRNFLYRNDGRTFLDVAYSAGVGYDTDGKPQAGMGADSADADGDGLPDIFVTNFSDELNALYRNRGRLEFEDVSESTGLRSALLPLGFGTKLFDFDNDGDLDIYVTNGHVIDNIRLYNPQLSYAQKDLLYENVDGHFQDVSAVSGPAFQIGSVGRGAAVGDYDNDGDLDIVVSNCGRSPVLMKNDGGNRNHWIAISARGVESNSFGLGAKVRVEAGGRVQLKEINNVASYLSSHDIRLYGVST